MKRWEIVMPKRKRFPKSGGERREKALALNQDPLFEKTCRIRLTAGEKKKRRETCGRNLS